MHTVCLYVLLTRTVCKHTTKSMSTYILPIGRLRKVSYAGTQVVSNKVYWTLIVSPLVDIGEMRANYGSKCIYIVSESELI